MISMRHEEKPGHLVRTELVIAKVLRYGVILCAAVIALGVLRSLSSPAVLHSTDTLVAAIESGKSVSDPVTYRSPLQLLQAAADLDADAIINLGLVILIALPILRVGLTVIVFAFERDWIFFAITLFVLGVLMLGISLGRGL